MCPLEDEKREEAGDIWAWLAARADIANKSPVIEGSKKIADGFSLFEFFVSYLPSRKFSISSFLPKRTRRSPSLKTYVGGGERRSPSLSPAP